MGHPVQEQRMSKTEMASSSSSAVAVMEYDCPVYGNNSDFVIDQGTIELILFYNTYTN